MKTLTEQLAQYASYHRDRRNILVGVLGAAVALAMVPVTAAGVPVLAAGGIAVLVGVLSRRDPKDVADTVDDDDVDAADDPEGAR